MKKSVVMIDDSTYLLRMLKDYFEDTLGFEVVATGTNGMQAIELYRKFQPDLICLDLTMPIMDGQDALAAILSEFPKARVLIISAVSGPSVLQCMKLGAKAYIEKPLRLEDQDFRKELEQTLSEIFA